MLLKAGMDLEMENRFAVHDIIAHHENENRTQIYLMHLINLFDQENQENQRPIFAGAACYDCPHT
ncbi:MAG: hypothetical protein R3C62_14885 [Chloroflexota bacterium]